MPASAVKDAELDRDLISRVEKPIKAPMHYAAVSVLSPKLHDVLDDETRYASTHFDSNRNPKTLHEAQKIAKMFNTPEKKASAIIKFFQNQSLTYSLKPEALDINNTADSFLFDKRLGYCVHFASSFVIMARMAGIPSRIVTGYKADNANSLKNYLPVKERDAHAWAELYLNEHWVRVETTSTASAIDAQTAQILGTNDANEGNKSFIERVNLYLMYIKYQVETWILYYSNIRQLQLIQYAKENPRFIFYLVLSLLSLLLITFSITLYFRRPRCTNKILCVLQPLLNTLKQEGYIREKDETMHQFFLRYMNDHPEKSAIKEVDKYYETISYGGDTSDATIKQFKRMVKMCLSS